jgi:hypothetical protein
MRCRPLLLSLLAAVLLGTGAAPAAAQSGDPFEPLPSAPAEPPVVVPTASDDDEGLQSWQQTLLIAGGTLLVLGIGVAIARDARRHAPDDSRGPGRAAEGFAGGPGAGADPGRRNIAARDRRRARARARTARASRKKNR